MIYLKYRVFMCLRKRAGIRKQASLCIRNSMNYLHFDLADETQRPFGTGNVSGSSENNEKYSSFKTRWGSGLFGWAQLQLLNGNVLIKCLFSVSFFACGCIRVLQSLGELSSSSSGVSTLKSFQRARWISAVQTLLRGLAGVIVMRFSCRLCDAVRESLFRGLGWYGIKTVWGTELLTERRVWGERSETQSNSPREIFT